MKHSVNIMINFSTGCIYCKSVHASLSLTQSWSVSGETCHWSLNCQLSDKTQLFGCFLKTFYTMAPMCSESTSLYTLLWKKANHPSLHCAWVVTKINRLPFILLWEKKSACQRHQLLRVFALAEIQWTVILMHRPASWRAFITFIQCYMSPVHPCSCFTWKRLIGKNAASWHYNAYGPDYSALCHLKYCVELRLGKAMLLVTC